MNYITHIVIMILSGLLSSMFVWSDKLSDVRLSLNDVYMIGLMTSWMLLFMSVLHTDFIVFILSVIGIIAMYYFIRKQSFVSKNQYYTGMIPHHSMAVLMSKRLLEKGERLTQEEKDFVAQIIKSQEKEIQSMKRFGA